MKAYAWATGRIDFGRKVPDGAILIAEAPAKKLRHEISCVARHAYDGKTLLVPGVPEAKNKNAAVDALIRFCDWIKPRFVKERALTPSRYLVSVKYAAGTYTTSGIGGVRASCTSGPQQAVERLAKKLYGDKVALRIEQVGSMQSAPSETWWHLYYPEAS